MSELVRGAIRDLLGMNWDSQEMGDWTVLTCKDLPMGRMILDWGLKQIGYFKVGETSEEITTIFRSLASRPAPWDFTIDRLQSAEYNAITDKLSLGVAYASPFKLFRAMDQLTAKGSTTEAVYAYSYEDIGGVTKTNFILIEWDEKLKKLKAFENALANLTSAIEKNNGVDSQKYRNLIYFLTGASVNGMCVKVGYLADGRGWVWDERASLLDKDVLADLQIDYNSERVHCHTCGFNELVSWVFFYEGDQLFNLHRAHIRHRENCESELR